MTIGLDLGSHQFRSIRKVEEKLVARCCPAVFTALTDSPAHRRLLQQSNTQFATCSSGQLLVFGEAAQEWSAMLNQPLTPLLRGGRIPSADPISRQILALMIDAILPTPAKPAEICQMTLPGGQSARSKERDADFFQQMVSLRGYQPNLMTATQALALAELQDVSFTGIVLTLGHTTCEFGITHLGREIVRCVVMSGLSTFDGLPRLGENELPADITISSEAVQRDYLRFFTDVVTEAKTQFELDGTLKTLPKPMSVICAGGITSAPTFLPLFQRAWDEAKWPTATRPIRVVSDPNLAVVRGCFIQGELDQPAERQAA